MLDFFKSILTTYCLSIFFLSEREGGVTITFLVSSLRGRDVPARLWYACYVGNGVSPKPHQTVYGQCGHKTCPKVCTG